MSQLSVKLSCCVTQRGKHSFQVCNQNLSQTATSYVYCRVVIYDNYSQYIHSPLLSTILTSAISLAPKPLPLHAIHMAHLSSSANMVLYRQPLCNLFIYIYMMTPTTQLFHHRYYYLVFTHLTSTVLAWRYSC